MQNLLNKKTLNFLLNPNILNFVLVIIIIITMIFVSFLISKSKKEQELIGKKSKPNKKGSKLFRSLKEKLYTILIFKGKEKLFAPIYSLILFALFLVFLFFLSIKHLFLALTLPIIIYFFITKIIEQFIVNFDKIVKDNFPTLANHMAKVFSGTGDLSIVLYESSKEVEEPLRSLILNLSRELMVDNSEKYLINFIEKTDNLWLHSFVFTLINYKETSSREDVVENLLMLADLIEKRKDLSEKMVEDRKPVVIINYMLLIIGTVIFIGNIFLNPTFKSFIFTPLGTFSILAGISAIFGTILINLKFTNIN